MLVLLTSRELLIWNWVKKADRQPLFKHDSITCGVISVVKGYSRKRALLKVDGTSFQVFWICKLWKERTKSQLNVITKFVYDSIAKLVLVQKRQLFCHQLLPWQRYLMIVQTYFWASKAHILKTNLVTPNFFLSYLKMELHDHLKKFLRSGFSINVKKGSLSIMKNSSRRNF